jgi:nucleotide-binding universal stress UspA family protein
MPTRGHGGLGREVVGSVAEYVLRQPGEAAVVLVGSRAASAT